MREHRIRVADRALAVREAGDPDGHPVVFFHGSPSSRLAVAAGEEAAGEKTVRLITFDRPGYGQSDPPRSAGLVIVHGAGHIAVFRHWRPMLRTLTGQAPADPS